MDFRKIALICLSIVVVSGCSHHAPNPTVKTVPQPASQGPQHAPISSGPVSPDTPPAPTKPVVDPGSPTTGDPQALHSFCKAFGPQSRNVPLVIMYHDIVESTENYTSDLDVRDFEHEMLYLKSNGFTTISIDDLTEFQKGKPLPKKPVLLSFDDGYIGDYNYAIPILRKLGLKATFFVHTHVVGKKTFVMHMSWDQLREVDADPLFKVYPHSVTHLHPFTELSREALRSELRDSQAKMKMELGGERDVTAYPFGRYNNDVLDLTRQYYRMAFTIAKSSDLPEYNCALALPRFKIQRTENSVQVFKNGINRWIENSDLDGNSIELDRESNTNFAAEFDGDE